MKKLLIPLLLLCMVVAPWASAGPSTHGHPLDNMSDNINQAINANAEVKVEPERYVEVDKLSSVTGWAAAVEGGATDATTASIAVSTDHIPHEDKLLSLEWDKANGTVLGAKIEKTLASIDASFLVGPSIIQWHVKHANFTNVDYVWIRVGSSAANYHEYRVDSDELTSGQWNTLSTLVANYDAQGGTGMDMSDIDYLALGVTMDGTANTIANLRFEEIVFLSATHSATSISSEVQVDTPNINILKLRGTVIGRNSGDVGNDTLRITNATDDIPIALTNTSIGLTTASVATQGGVGSLSAKLRLVTSQLNTIDADTGAIKTAVELIDHLTAANSGDKDAATQRVAIATDDINLAAINTAVTSAIHGSKTLLIAKIDVDLTGGADSGAIIGAEAGEVIYVVELLVNPNVQCNLQFTDGGETASTSGLELYLASYGGLHLKRDPGYRFALDSSEGMFLDDIAGGTVNVRGYVWYYQE